MKTTVKKYVLPAIAFLLIFTLLLTLLTFLYYPKWSPTTEKNLMSGLYREPENTIDVLCLGSCNMYTAFSSVMMYEKYGITGYSFCCPDQELSTSYYYLKDALKTQKPKVVVLESLFITHYNTEKRERYNRFALDYMPFSWNKLALAWYTAKNEAALMPKYDDTSSDRLLTFTSYLFPLLRYHNRTDLTQEDVDYWFDTDLYSYSKGSLPHYSFSVNDGNLYNKVFNGDDVNATAQKFFPKIKELCDENGIQLIVMKNPNYARWGHDDAQTKLARDYVSSFGVPYIDFLSNEYNCFTDNDYACGGNLNVYGMQKLSYSLGSFFVNELGLTPTPLSDADRAKWDECVARLYSETQENGFNISSGEIKRISNLVDAVNVQWNLCEDCSEYELFRSKGHGSDFEKIARVSGDNYSDSDVENGQGYTYYVQPLSGEKGGTASQPAYSIFVAMPENLDAANKNGKFKLTWDPVDGVDYYRLFRRYCADTTFHGWSKTEETTYLNDSRITEGKMYDFSLIAVIEEDGVTYESESTTAKVLSQKRPVITQGYTSNGNITIKWKELKNADEIIVYRRSENEDEFTKYDTLSGTKTQFTDKDVKADLQYFYKIASRTTSYGYTAQSMNSNTVGVVAR